MAAGLVLAWTWASPVAALDWRKPARDEVIAALDRLLQFGPADVGRMLDAVARPEDEFLAIIAELEQGRGRPFEPSARFGQCRSPEVRDETFPPSDHQLECVRPDYRAIYHFNRSAERYVESFVLRIPFPYQKDGPGKPAQLAAYAPMVDMQAKNLSMPDHVLWTQEGEWLMVLVDLR